MDDLVEAFGHILRFFGRLVSGASLEFAEIFMRWTGERTLKALGRLPDDPIQRESEEWVAIGVGCVTWLAILPIVLGVLWFSLR